MHCKEIWREVFLINVNLKDWLDYEDLLKDYSVQLYTRRKLAPLSQKEINQKYSFKEIELSRIS
jgi:hypothetical protein